MKTSTEIRKVPTSQDFQRVARAVKRELYGRQLGFKTYPCERLITELNGGSGGHICEDIWKGLGAAFLQEGLFIFPGLEEAKGNGFVRVFRSGTTMAHILSVIAPTVRASMTTRVASSDAAARD
jgi:hypothetical protein